MGNLTIIEEGHFVNVTPLQVIVVLAQAAPHGEIFFDIRLCWTFNIGEQSVQMFLLNISIYGGSKKPISGGDLAFAKFGNP